jgi:2-polyprenyl-6-hydroxyphenyl methylase/3-demethylubiquinone-9 3-methyltransferase
MTKSPLPDQQHAPQVGPPADAFRFGENWQRYIADHLNPEREGMAAESLRDLVGVDLRDKTFLDIGSGSGLFSLCAYKAGAARVTSVDVDPDAVVATQRLRASVGDPENWVVRHDSILDAALVRQLSPVDIVYCWGVLHHTGSMYEAITNAASLVSPGGTFCIAIYNRVTDRFMSSERWHTIKRTYNHSPRAVQSAMLAAYAGYWALGRLRNRQNPLRAAREYTASRGMALKPDLVDWLGGYPYEFASADEIVEFCEKRCGMSLLRLLPVAGDGNGNNQFVFQRTG